jgi:hypothetical protein
MWDVQIIDDRVRVGERFVISFQRTLRIPDDGRVYPLPPTLGVFPVRRVQDYAAHLPEAWGSRGGVFFAMYQREAMWLAFEAASWKPNAVKIGAGGINALTGDIWQDGQDAGLQADPQNYIVCPDQPWLDGFNTGDEVIRQFVAMPLGMGYTLEGQLTGREEMGGLQVLVFEPRPGIFPDEPPPKPPPGLLGGPLMMMAPLPAGSPGMGLGAGGQITQKIYPDEHGLQIWDTSQHGSLFVHILNSQQYQDVTGEPPPPTPVSAKTYTEYGFPWFDLYDEEKGHLVASDAMKEVKSIHEMDEGLATPEEDSDRPVEIPPEQVQGIDRDQP